MRIAETGLDLGILTAVASSMRNRRIDPDTTVVGEVGLGGEIRSIPRIESRIKEAIHMGFKRCLIPKRNLKGISQELNSKINIHGVDLVEQAVDILLD